MGSFAEFICKSLVFYFVCLFCWSVLWVSFVGLFCRPLLEVYRSFAKFSKSSSLPNIYKEYSADFREFIYTHIYIFTYAYIILLLSLGGASRLSTGQSHDSLETSTSLSSRAESLATLTALIQ